MLTTRFAPSPTGHLHLGHAFAALTAYDRAQASGGRFLLRIEDIDQARCRPEFTEAICEDLTWLGIVWPESPRIQSSHLAEYCLTLDRLDAVGLLYRCFCTRAEIAASLNAPHDSEPCYPGTCRTLDPAIAADRTARGHPYALRLRTHRARQQTGPLRYHEETEGWCDADPAPFGDIVLARKDIPASYHLCVTHDDARDGVSLVTRGADLRPATAIHVLLQRLLGWPTPDYAHHPLLTDPSGRRLAKRDRSVTLHALRASGATPDTIRTMIGAQNNPCRIGKCASLSSS